MLIRPVPLAQSLLLLVPAGSRAEERIDRDRLIDDLRQLASTLESAHPDPYVRGGGRLAFHRRLHEAIARLPPEGLAPSAFLRVVQPVVAAVGDGHTRVSPAEGITGRGLPASGLRVTTSSKLHVYYPDDPLGHTELTVDEPLTFGAWKGYGFDRHAAILLARDIFRSDPLPDRRSGG